MTFIGRVQMVKEWFVERRGRRPERLQRRAEAQAHRLEMKRRHESDPRGGGGGGG
jgi:hypothetical protein